MKNIYQLRVKNKNHELITSISPCDLIKNNFNEKIKIIVSKDEIFSIDYITSKRSNNYNKICNIVK
jgi:hypothetical protein